MTAIVEGTAGDAPPRAVADVSAIRLRKSALIGFAVAAMLVVAPLSPRAQDVELAPGDGVVTRFSGFEDVGDRALDEDGVVAEVMELGSGREVDAEPNVLASFTAEDIGQVFAVEIGGAEAPAIYLAATSAYGLYRDGDGWAAGMWGPDGGPGTIWRITPGEDPAVFADIGTEDRPNPGAALGDLAFDSFNDQLFVSDLSTGLIHALDPESGAITQTFDHGLDGRSYFLDSGSAEYLVLDVAPLDGQAGPRFDDCRDASGRDVAFEDEPACWGYADFRRRVWGLGVRRDPVADTVRLYYAVWGGAALGAADWETAGDDARTSIWSVRLDGNGAFDLTDVRREVVLPPLGNDSGDAQGETSPVVDIAFTPDGAMVLAERGRPEPDLTAEPARLVDPEAARVLMLVQDEGGAWAVNGRYDVGASERGGVGAPFIRSSAAGGVALHTVQEDGENGGDRLWMTVDPLCTPESPCDAVDDGDEWLAGLQASPLDAISELLPPRAASGDYPPSGPVTPPTTLEESALVVLSRDLPVGGLGQIAIMRGEEDEAVVVDVPEGAPAEVQAGAAPRTLPLPDLAIAKSGIEGCRPGGECTYRVSVTNVGPVDFVGPILITDTIGSPGVSLVRGGSVEWDCYSADGNVYCHLPETTLSPRAETRFDITLRPSANHGEPRLNNCAAITWLGRQGRDRIRAVQAQLRREGYEPGVVDGIMGPNTADAISAAQRDFGLSVIGTIDDDLVEALFGPGAALGGDASNANDQDCALVMVDLPPRPSHARQLSAFHHKFESQFHDASSSRPVEFHDPALSSFHVTYRSGLHDGVTSGPLVLHRRSLSRFHLDYRSEFHDGVYSRFVPLHSPAISAFHERRGSIYHDWRTSDLEDRHRRSLSSFHRDWSSERHDGRITRLEQRHWVQLSAFHRRFSSRMHDDVTTRVRPSHDRSISQFHRRGSSELHDRRTSRPLPVHGPELSRFHDRAPSALHDRRTTGAEDRHMEALSVFHRTFSSRQHDRRFSGPRPEHREDLSALRERPQHSHGTSFGGRPPRDRDREPGDVGRHDQRESAEVRQREQEEERRRQELLEQRREELRRQRELQERDQLGERERMEELQRQRQEELQRQRQERAEQERLRQEELQRRREQQLDQQDEQRERMEELQRQRQEELQRQRQEQTDQRRRQQEELQRQRELEQERQRQRQEDQQRQRQEQIDQQRRQQEELQRQRQEQLEQRRQEQERQQELQRQRQEEVERQRQQQIEQQRRQQEELQRQRQEQLQQRRQEQERQQELQRQRQPERQRQEELQRQQQQQQQIDQQRRQQEELQRQRQQQIEQQRRQQEEQQRQRQQQLQQRQLQLQQQQQQRQQQLQQLQQQRQQRQQQQQQRPRGQPQPFVQ